eukprot:10028360-Alexandrium_andersonii.AAC.1
MASLGAEKEHVRGFEHIASVVLSTCRRGTLGPGAAEVSTWWGHRLNHSAHGRARKSNRPDLVPQALCFSTCWSGGLLSLGSFSFGA